MRPIVSQGPCGGPRGGEWSFNNDGKAIIKGIVLVHGDGIDSLVFQHEFDANIKSSPRFGGSGGLHSENIELDWPKEYITLVSGYYGVMWWQGPTVVRSLTFVTNKKTYGPFGREEGDYFEFSAQSGKIVGFHGRCGRFLDAIGVYINPNLSLLEAQVSC